MKWRDDAGFIEALGRRAYLGPDGAPYMSESLTIYMWELYRDGIDATDATDREESAEGRE